MSTLTRERVRGDVDVLSRAGLDLEEFLTEAATSVQRAVPWLGACVATHDPATHLLTSHRTYGDLSPSSEQNMMFGAIEYDSDEQTTYRALAQRDLPAIGMHLATDGDVARSVRMDRLMLPAYDYRDEARLLFRSADGTFWGGIALFRGAEDGAFTAEEIEYLGRLGESFARGVRGGFLTRMSGAAPTTGGPAVVVVNAGGEIVQASPSAQARMDGLCPIGVRHGDALGVVGSLVAAARRLARTPGSTEVARARVRTSSGQWLLLHASPLAGLGDRAGEVVVTLEEARPPEIVSLVVAAFGLTQRERDVTTLVLQGVDTKEIAATLHVSTYTVQDHLKAVFDKADVRSRRELIARIYFDQYVPRMGGELGPSGWYAG